MNERKQHVINMAHQLFIDKGFQATSIQDILKYSSIAKGTFYNYFSSKNDLLIALFKSLFEKMEKERNNLLIGQDPANIEVFTRQMELLVKINREYNLSALIEEVFMANDEELKQFIKRSHLQFIQWLYFRFIQLFGEERKPYLLDCAIMFLGILQHNFKFYALANGRHHSNIYVVVRYSVDRLVQLVHDVSTSKSQLLQPEMIETWFSNEPQKEYNWQRVLFQSIDTLKKEVAKLDNKEKYFELIDFIYEEILEAKEPRQFLINSALTSLKDDLSIKELFKLERLILDFFQFEKNSL